MVVALALLAAEIALRLALGLGDPPRYVRDADASYVLGPSSSYRRFGRRIEVNSRSMRAPEPPPVTDHTTARVLVLGDSIVHGGQWTDQGALATTLLAEALSARLGRPVWVGNASAPGWGPESLDGYARSRGFFGAAAVVIVLSSHDAFDSPPLGAAVGSARELPGVGPRSALAEGAREVLERLGWVTRSPPARSLVGVFPGDEAERRALAALRSLVGHARGGGARVLFAHHLDRAEAAGGQPGPGHAKIAALAEALEVARVELGARFREAEARGEAPYRDAIHPNDLGQRLIAEALEEPVAAALEE